MTNSNVLAFQPRDRARQRYMWYEQLIADGLHDHVGIAHEIARNDFRVSYNQLAAALGVHRRTAITYVETLLQRRHLVLATRGKRFRGGATVNQYRMLRGGVIGDGNVTNIGGEITTTFGGENATPISPERGDSPALSRRRLRSAPPPLSESPPPTIDGSKAIWASYSEDPDDGTWEDRDGRIWDGKKWLDPVPF
jgi:hypothetical protein